MGNVPAVVAVVVEVVEGSVTGVSSEAGRIRSLSSTREDNVLLSFYIVN